jgi:hypothetical protein
MKKLLLILTAILVAALWSGCDALKGSEKKRGQVDLGKSQDTEKKGEVKGMPSGAGGGVVTDDGLH